jgi:hypothetical protein
MGPTQKQQSDFETLERIEATILPNAALLLEALLEAASIDPADRGNRVRAAELRTLASQLAILTRQVEAIAPQRAPEWPIRMSA